MWYIGTKSQCEYYNNKVTSGEGYNGATQRWATPVQHPNNGSWAIVKHDNYTHSSMQLVNELGKDWNEELDIDLNDTEI